MITIIKEVLETVNIVTISSKDLLNSKNLILDFSLDSINFLSVIVELEKKLDVEIDIENLDIANFESVTKLSKFLKELQGKQN